MEREHNDHAWHTWHTAALSRWPRGRGAKPFPKLDTLLAKQAAAVRQRQSWQQQQAIMDMWVARTRRVEREAKRKAR